MLSERDLADLGIGRADIGRIAREAAASGTIDIHEWRLRNEEAGVGGAFATDRLVGRALSLKAA